MKYTIQENEYSWYTEPIKRSKSLLLWINFWHFYWHFLYYEQDSKFVTEDTIPVSIILLVMIGSLILIDEKFIDWIFLSETFSIFTSIFFTKQPEF